MTSAGTLFGDSRGFVALNLDARPVANQAIRALAVSKAYAAAAGDDCFVYVLPLAFDRLGAPTSPGRHDRPVHALAFSPGGDLLVSGADDGTLRVWHLASGGRWRDLDDHAGPINGIAWIDDTRICVIDEAGYARVHDVRAGTRCGAWCHPVALCAVRLHEAILVVGTEDGQLLRLAYDDGLTRA
ncbi:MAG: hypothetical protein V4850_34805 [Myxococcota bacterium]